MYNMSCVRDMTNIKKRQTLCSGVWLSLARARLLWEQDAAGSNPVTDLDNHKSKHC